MKTNYLKNTLTYLIFICISHFSFGQINLSADNNFSKETSYTKTSTNNSNRIRLTGEFYTLHVIQSDKDIFNKFNSGLRLMLGYQFNNFLVMSVGSAFENATIPLCFDIKMVNNSKNTSPVLGINIAQNIKNNDLIKEGVRFNPTIGISSKIGKKSLMMLNIGYCIYTSTITTYTYNSTQQSFVSYSNTENISNQYLSFGGGFIF